MKTTRRGLLTGAAATALYHAAGYVPTGGVAAAQTAQSDARSFAESTVPQARADADSAVQAARGDADSALSLAKGDAAAFVALDAQYRANSAVVRERLYRDAVERAIQAAGSVQWVPPPAGATYHGFRINVTPPRPVVGGEEPEEP